MEEMSHDFTRQRAIVCRTFTSFVAELWKLWSEWGRRWMEKKTESLRQLSAMKAFLHPPVFVATQMM